MPRCTRAWHGLSTVISVMLQHTTGVMSSHGVQSLARAIHCHICHVVAAHHWCHVRPRCTRAWHGLSTVMSYLSCQVAQLVSCQAKVYQSLAWFIHCHVISFMSCCSTPLVSCQAKVYQSQARFIHCHVISVMSCCSTPLVSCQAKVYQSLARFIHWTDSLLVSPQTSFNKDNAREIIDTLSAGIKVSLTSGFAELSMFLLWVGISPPCLL